MKYRAERNISKSGEGSSLQRNAERLVVRNRLVLSLEAKMQRSSMKAAGAGGAEAAKQEIND